MIHRAISGREPFRGCGLQRELAAGGGLGSRWSALRERLRTEAHNWLEAIRRLRELSQVELTGVLAGVAHLAYHLGAIRQIDRTARGPRARD